MKCSAHTSAGNPCKNNAIRGGTVCHKHGGSAPQVRAKAEQRVAKMKVGDALRKMGVDHVDPMDGLLKEVTRSASLLNVYSSLVSELETQKDGIYGANHLNDFEPHVLVLMFNNERDRFAKLCKMAIDAGLEERTVQLAEQQANLMVQVIQRVLDDPQLALTREQRAAGRQVSARHLRAVS